MSGANSEIALAERNAPSPADVTSGGAAADTSVASVAYEYKPALMGSPWQLELTREGLTWRYGRHHGVVQPERITRVRLSYRPVTMQPYRFLMEIWSPDAPKIVVASTTWRSMTDQARQDGAYRAFVRALHARLPASSGTSFVAGMNPVLYVLGLALFGVAAVSLVAMAVRGLRDGETAGAAMVGGFLLLFGWSVGNVVWRNRPQRYRPDAIPPQVLPTGR